MPTVSNHPLLGAFAPEWAREWGHDRYGPWASFSIGSVRQLLRWIPPGQFLMGSETPDAQANWTENEFPQHWATLSRGFWLFDTPVTQELWETLLGDREWNFPNPEAPAESVSWTDCQEFIQALNGRIAGLNLWLPTEAQWEYACRAGDDSARYGALEDIGWFAGNSGGSTRPVKIKEPNRLGLYDMLGNVWEWCRDAGLRAYGNAVVADPLNEAEGSDVHRVIRGGGWHNSAARVRAAYRDRLRPDGRNRHVGFRCLSSPEPGKSG